MFKFCIFLVLILRTWAQITKDGSCPPSDRIENFDAKRFSGVWYEIRRLSGSMQDNEECTYYTLNETNNGSIAVHGHSTDLLSGASKNWFAFATPVNSEADGVYNVVAKHFQFKWDRFMVLETDYDHYAIVYTCISEFDTSESFGWLWERSRELDSNYNDRFIATMNSLQMPINSVYDTNQHHCP